MPRNSELARIAKVLEALESQTRKATRLLDALLAQTRRENEFLTAPKCPECFGEGVWHDSIVGSHLCHACRGLGRILPTQSASERPVSGSWKEVNEET